MACCLVRTKPLSESIIEYCLLAPWEPTSMKFEYKFIHFSSKEIHFKMLSGKWRPFCLGLNVSRIHRPYTYWLGLMCHISIVCGYMFCSIFLCSVSVPYSLFVLYTLNVNCVTRGNKDFIFVCYRYLCIEFYCWLLIQIQIILPIPLFFVSPKSLSSDSHVFSYQGFSVQAINRICHIGPRSGICKKKKQVQHRVQGIYF